MIIVRSYVDFSKTLIISPFASTGKFIDTTSFGQKYRVFYTNTSIPIDRGGLSLYEPKFLAGSEMKALNTGIYGI